MSAWFCYCNVEKKINKNALVLGRYYSTFYRPNFVLVVVGYFVVEAELLVFQLREYSLETADS